MKNPGLTGALIGSGIVSLIGGFAYGKQRREIAELKKENQELKLERNPKKDVLIKDPLNQV